MSTLTDQNFDRIWLEPREGADPYIGRQWCQDNQWGEDGIEYVRADVIGNEYPHWHSDRIEQLERENAELRHIISNCAAALVTGAFVSPKASVEFMRKVPKEISLVVSDLRRATQEAQRD